MIEWKRLSCAFAGVLALSALSGPTWAQLSPGNGPVNASAQHSRIDTDSQTGNEIMYLDGEVELLQDGRRLRCDHAKVIQAPGPNGTANKVVVQMEATGNVFYVAEDQTVRGDYGIYTKADDLLKVTGNVIMTRGKSVATGNLFTDKVHDGVMNMVSDAGSANKGRVKAIMYPNKPADAAAPAHP
jgi:lipopolysaccharide transport protein LptA